MFKRAKSGQERGQHTQHMIVDSRHRTAAIAHSIHHIQSLLAIIPFLTVSFPFTALFKPPARDHSSSFLSSLR